MNVGVGVVIERDGMYLLGRRLALKHGHGEYSLPGGKPDHGESPEEAARRELWEEAGMWATSMTPLGIWTYDRWPDHQVHCVTLYFMADVEDQQPLNMEPDKCAGWDWYSPDNLPSPLFCGVERILGVVA